MNEMNSETRDTNQRNNDSEKWLKLDKWHYKYLCSMSDSFFFAEM